MMSFRAHRELYEQKCDLISKIARHFVLQTTMQPLFGLIGVQSLITHATPASFHHRNMVCNKHQFSSFASRSRCLPCHAVGKGPEESDSRLSRNLGDLRKWMGLEPLDTDIETYNDSDDETTTTFEESNGIASIVQPPSRQWGDWSSDDNDWDLWTTSNAVDFDDEAELAVFEESIVEQRRARGGQRSRVRDEYLRPVVNPQGAYDRVSFEERDSEERVFVESVTNQFDTKESAKFLATIIGVPIVVGSIVGHIIAQPLWNFAETVNPRVFDISDWQKIEAADEIQEEEERVRTEISLGAAPPITDEQLLLHLREKAAEIQDRMMQENRIAMSTVVSDSCAATTMFLLLLFPTPGRQILLRTALRTFSSMSDSGKAFLIVVVTNTTFGYHSAETWMAVLRMLSWHYHIQPDEMKIGWFVSTIPVGLDTLFKYWIFIYLNKLDPAAAVTLKHVNTK